VLTRCAGSCDEDVNRCLCGEGARFPQRPMVHCVYYGVENDMPWQAPGWASFAQAPRSAFWTPGGADKASRARFASVAWCDADPDLSQRPKVRCKCYDGQLPERLCAPVSSRSTEGMFCLNRCSEHGDCASGFCRCWAGYQGADCSIKAVDGQRAGVGSATSVSGSIHRLSAGANASSTDTGTAASTSAAGDGGSVIPRPRVYIYELPGDFNTFLLARRQSPESCTTREYAWSAIKGAPEVKWSGNLYGAEIALHEALLASPHRVMDPELADFFFVPAYGGCFVSEFNRASPIHWLCDSCHKGSAADLATLRAMKWNEALRKHISTARAHALNLREWR